MVLNFSTYYIYIKILNKSFLQEPTRSAEIQLVFSAQKLDSGMGSIRQGTSISSVSSVGSYSFQVYQQAAFKETLSKIFKIVPFFHDLDLINWLKGLANNFLFIEIFAK